MEILLLGGTGAMGRHLTEALKDRGNNVTVTSRSEHMSEGHIRYIKGNAQDDDFFEKICRMRHWDAIVDFMVYETEEFRKRVVKLLAATDQYVFISSARVYADCSDNLITEDSPRLLDVCGDKEYLSTNEYALAKAREENVLFAQNNKNWSIVRPSLTYSERRLQLGVYEKENWLYRALHGRSIVFSKDLMERSYTLSYGRDVADGIAAIIGKPGAKGEVFNIVTNRSYKWKEIIELYVKQIEKITGRKPNVVFTEQCTNLAFPDAKYQVLYGRYFNRFFDNSKIRKFTDTTEWIDAKEGLAMCLERFLLNPSFNNINWRMEAYIDKAAGERTPLSEINSFKDKIIYLCYRYNMEWVIKVYKKFKIGGVLKNTKII
jgi:nucleoside-diphosphate-sugar epimerase